MSSGLQPTLELIWINNYTALAAVTVVVHDYFLVISREIEYVWNRPWTWVSVIFILVRYIGFTMAIVNALCVRARIQSVIPIYAAFHSCTILSLVVTWMYQIFLVAADWVMALRVYAMWNQSKSILYILLFIFVAQAVVSIVFAGIYYNPNTHFSNTVVQVVNFSFCNPSFTDIPPLYGLYAQLPRFVFGIVLLFLATTPTLKQLMTMYKVTKYRQPNRYIQLLIRDGILYFFLNVLINVTALLVTILPSTANNIAVLVLSTFGNTAICIVMPRFIISMRELYEHDARGRWQGVDSAFGMHSSPEPDVSAIMWAEVTSDQDESMEAGEHESEGIQLNERASSLDRT